MKQKNNYRYLLMGLMMAIVSSAVMLSCKDDDPSLAELRDDKIAYLADSLRVSDSLRRLNQAGVVNYAITVVSGSTSTLFKASSRTEGTSDIVEGALVTISQFGKVVTDTTDAFGMVVLNGFFRGAVNVTVKKEDFTTASFVTAVKFQDTTRNGSINFVGNIIPIFETTGANTATISGVAKFQSDLTNTTRENVPAGTTLTAHIDAMDDDFYEQFLSPELSIGPNNEILVGVILDAAYSTGVIGTTAADGTYSVTVPAAIDGLPIVFEYSDIAANRLRFDTGDDENSANRTMTERAVYSFNNSPSFYPAAGGVDITFDGGSGAAATANVSSVGTVETIVVTAGGSGYSGTPIVQITGGGGTGATATATVSNGVVTGVTVVNKGSGYTGIPALAVTFLSGTLATASSTLDTNGRVLSVSVLNSGSGYTSVPTVTFTGGTPTTVATGTAVLSGGRVTSITVTDPGAGYSIAGPPSVVLTGGGFNVAATAQPNMSGVSVASVVLGNVGQNYNYAPSVLFSAPQVPGGVRATGTATVDAATGFVTGIQLTNVGSGYTGVPTVTLNAGTGATATGYLTGSAITSINVTAQGNNYVAPPTVKITPTSGNGGTGAAATATVVGGKVTAITLTNGGIGYTAGNVDIELISGEGAQAVAQIGAGGAVTSIRVTTGGSGYTGAPLVTITGVGGLGNGATATATVSPSGQVTGVTIAAGAGGSGYVEGNTPVSSEGTNSMFFPYSSSLVKPGIKYINDVYYGTGNASPN